MLVPIPDVVNAMQYAAPLLEPAIERSDGRWNIWDVIAGCLQGHMHLWLSIRDEKVQAAMITRFIQYPRLRALGLQFIGGKGALRAIMGHQDEIIEWAKAQGCDELEGYARKGWLRVLDWKPSWTFMTRKI